MFIFCYNNSKKAGGLNMKVRIDDNRIEYKFTRIEHTKENITHLHWQREIEIIHIIHGEYEVRCDKNVFHAKDGDILVFGSGNIHSLIPLRDDCHVDVILFGAKFLHKFFNKCDVLKHYITSQKQKKCGVFDNLNIIFDNIAIEILSTQPNSEIITQAELIKLWAILSRYFKDDAKKIQEKNAHFERFQKVFKYIDDNYTNDLKLEDIATLLNYTPGYISKLFAEFSGMTFKKYLNTVRVKKACELMEITDLKLSEISIMCGFGSIRAFNENFLKIMKCCPRDYMKEGLQK